MINDTLSRYRTWRGHEHQDTPLRLECHLGEPATPRELTMLERQFPLDIVELWRECRDAVLFEDVEYGQWGLRILSPAASVERTEHEIAERPDDLTSDDLVVGEFLGDQELLVIAGRSESHDVVVALPLDPRSDWYVVSATIDDFLIRYFDAHGNKYWEK